MTSILAMQGPKAHRNLALLRGRDAARKNPGVALIDTMVSYTMIWMMDDRAILMCRKKMAYWQIEK